jgi:hypothetical protein
MDSSLFSICIGRQLGSGGREIGSKLANDFGCEYFDREILNLAAKGIGFSPSVFVERDESASFMRGVLRCIPFIHNSLYRNSFSQESLFEFQCNAISKAAEKGSCLFVGRCADYILRNRKRVISIFISANMDDRLVRVCKQHGITRSEARRKIEKADEKRAAYYNYYTDKTWGEAASYDLCINSSILGIEKTIEHIRTFVQDELQIK